MPNKGYIENMSVQRTVISTPHGEVSIDRIGCLFCANPKSESVTQWCWLSNTNLLAVWWKGKIYRYMGVPFSTIYDLLGTDSVGSFVNSRIKPYHEVEKEL